MTGSPVGRSANAGGRHLGEAEVNPTTRERSPPPAPPDTIPPPMTTPPPALPDRDLLLWMYERMGLIRDFAERLKTLVERGVPVGPVHFDTGQEAVAADRISDRAAAYRMPGVTVDGQDVIAVWEAAGEAVRGGRAGKGPSLVECLTYRYHGHHQGDETLRYRTADEERTARERDCLRRFREVLFALGVGGAEVEGIDTRNRERLDEAIAFAERSPVPGPEELLSDVYVENGS